MRAIALAFLLCTAYDNCMAHDPNCPMCKAVDTSVLVWNFPHSVAFVGPWQYYTGYCLLVSREHATELSNSGRTAPRSSRKWPCSRKRSKAAFRPHKLNYELLGNVVPHLHWHIFPRSVTDPDRLQPVWLALERAKTDAIEKRRLETGSVPCEEVRARLRDWLTKSSAREET